MRTRRARVFPAQRIGITLLCAAALGAAGATVHADGDATDSRTFRRHLREALPDRGSVRARYERPDSFSKIPGRGTVILVGHDVATRAWYKVFDGKVFGVTTSGDRFSGTTGPGGVAIEEAPPPHQLSDDAVDSFLPHAILLAIRDRPEVIESASHRPDGGYRVRLSFPAGKRAFSAYEAPPGVVRQPRTWTLDLDARCRPVLWERYDADQHPMKFEYDEKHEAGIPVPAATEGGGWVLAAVEHAPSTRPEWFSVSAVEELAAHGNTEPNADDTLRVLRTTLDASDLPPERVESIRRLSNKINRDPRDAWKWGLIGGGAVLIVLALVAKRRGWP